GASGGPAGDRRPELARGARGYHDGEPHRGAGHADEQLARRRLVEGLEVHLREDDAGRALALETIDRIDEEITFAIFGIAEHVVAPGERLQPVRPQRGGAEQAR